MVCIILEGRLFYYLIVFGKWEKEMKKGMSFMNEKRNEERNDFLGKNGKWINLRKCMVWNID